MQLEKLLSALSGAQVNISISVSPSTANTKSEKIGPRRTNGLGKEAPMEEVIHDCLVKYCWQYSECYGCPLVNNSPCPLLTLKEKLCDVLDEKKNKKGGN